MQQFYSQLVIHTKYVFMFQRKKLAIQRGEFQEVVLVAMSETAAGVRRWRGSNKGRRKSSKEEAFERLRPASSISKTSKTSSILDSLTTTEVKEEEEEMRDEVPFLPALALPGSPTPPPSRPSSTLPPLPDLGMTSPERRRKVTSTIFNMIPRQIIATKIYPTKNENSGGTQEDHRTR